MRGADLLFLPMHNLPSGYRARIVPGKTYEYLASGRPILAAVPDGDARDLLERAGTAFLTRPDDVDAMSAVIVDAVRRRDRQTRPAPDPELLAGYERRKLTRRLAELFDGVIAVTRRNQKLPGLAGFRAYDANASRKAAGIARDACSGRPTGPRTRR